MIIYHSTMCSLAKCHNWNTDTRITNSHSPFLTEPQRKRQTAQRLDQAPGQFTDWHVGQSGLSSRTGGPYIQTRTQTMSLWPVTCTVYYYAWWSNSGMASVHRLAHVGNFEAFVFTTGCRFFFMTSTSWFPTNANKNLYTFHSQPFRCFLRTTALFHVYSRKSSTKKLPVIKRRISVHGHINQHEDSI